MTSIAGGAQGALKHFGERQRERVAGSRNSGSTRSLVHEYVVRQDSGDGWDDAFMNTGRGNGGAKPRFYLYLSDAKVDMLFGQIPQKFLERIEAELSLDLKVIGVKLSERPTEETRYSKLRVAERYIRSDLKVGTIDEPKEYFEGALPMRWGLLQGAGSIAYFTAQTDETIVGLGGSATHLIGGSDEARQGTIGDSFAWRIVSALVDVRETPQGATTVEDRETFADDIAQASDLCLPGVQEDLAALSKKSSFSRSSS